MANEYRSAPPGLRRSAPPGLTRSAPPGLRRSAPPGFQRRPPASPVGIDHDVKQMLEEATDPKILGDRHGSDKNDKENELLLRQATTPDILESGGRRSRRRRSTKRRRTNRRRRSTKRRRTKRHRRK